MTGQRPNTAERRRRGADLTHLTNSFANRRSSPGWWARAVGEFGASMGFQHTADWTMDTLNLSVDGGRYLVDIERSADDILLATFRHVPLSDVEEKIMLLLRSCSPDSHHPYFLQAGLKGDDVIVLAVRLHRSEAGRMYNAFEFIRKLFADARL